MFEIATINDAEEILQLQKLAYQSEAVIYDDYKIAPLTQPLDSMIDDLQKQTILKATCNGRITGSVRGYVQNGQVYRPIICSSGVSESGTRNPAFIRN